MFLPTAVRVPYQDRPLTQEQAAALSAVSACPGVEVTVVQDPEDVAFIAQVAVEAARIEAGIERISEESAAVFRATERQKNRHRCGISLDGQGSDGLGVKLTQGILALFPSMAAGEKAGERFVSQTETQVAHTPAYVLVTTADNSRGSQVLSGMVYARVQLVAEAMGLAVHPLSQALEEYPEMEAVRHKVHARYAPRGETIQMLVRVGVPTKNVPLSMRRDAEDLLVR